MTAVGDPGHGGATHGRPDRRTACARYLILPATSVAMAVSDVSIVIT
jgi:hypothetical protein